MVQIFFPEDVLKIRILLGTVPNFFPVFLSVFRTSPQRHSGLSEWVVIDGLEWFCPGASSIHFEAQLKHFKDLCTLSAKCFFFLRQ